MQLRNVTRWLSLSTLAGIGSLLSSNTALAAGFALRNDSTSGMGVGLSSNTVNSSDASGLGSNPAIMSEFKGHSISVNVNQTMANIDAKDASSTWLTTGTPHPVQGKPEVSDVSAPVTIPYLYGIHQVSDQVHVGWSVTVPYGTNTDYDDNWTGRYHATNTELTTIDFTLHGSYKVNEMFTAGLSLGWEQAKGELGTAVDFGTAAFLTAQAQGVPDASNPYTAARGAADVLTSFEGDSNAVTWGLGFLVKPMPGSRLGITYKGSVKQEAEGDLKWSPTNATASTILTASRSTSPDRFNDSSSAKLELELPWVLSVGYAHDIADFTVYANVTQTAWSSFEDLTVEWAGNSSITELNWEDSTYFGIGGDYRFSPELTFRAGVGQDQSVVSDSDRTPRTPDNDRTILALGAGYRAGSLNVDFGIQKLFIDETKIALKADAYADNNARGNLDAKLDIDPLIVMLGAGYTF